MEIKMHLGPTIESLSDYMNKLAQKDERLFCEDLKVADLAKTISDMAFEACRIYKNVLTVLGGQGEVLVRGDHYEWPFMVDMHGEGRSFVLKYGSPVPNDHLLEKMNSLIFQSRFGLRPIMGGLDFVSRAVFNYDAMVIEMKKGRTLRFSSEGNFEDLSAIPPA